MDLNNVLTGSLQGKSVLYNVWKPTGSRTLVETNELPHIVHHNGAGTRCTNLYWVKLWDAQRIWTRRNCFMLSGSTRFSSWTQPANLKAALMHTCMIHPRIRPALQLTYDCISYLNVGSSHRARGSPCCAAQSSNLRDRGTWHLMAASDLLAELHWHLYRKKQPIRLVTLVEQE